MNLRPDIARRLTVDWVVRLLRERGVDIEASMNFSDQAYEFGRRDAFSVIGTFVAAAPYVAVTTNGEISAAVRDACIEEATKRVAEADFGGKQWYSADLQLFDKPKRGRTLGQLMHDVVSERYRTSALDVWARLGAWVLIEPFASDESRGFGERQFRYRLHVAAPGPLIGFTSDIFSRRVMSTSRLVVSFGLGQSFALPVDFYPTPEAEVEGLQIRAKDRKVPTLARRGIGLDISGFPPIGGVEVFERLRSALVTFDAATRESSDSIASVLFVVVAECLAVPVGDACRSWRDKKVVARFLSFYEELYGKGEPTLFQSAIDDIIANENFEAVFNIRKGKRGKDKLRALLLDEIYDFRSTVVHSGVTLAGDEERFSDSASIRRTLLADFAEAAILAYLVSPRSSIVGHPCLDPRKAAGWRLLLQVWREYKSRSAT